MPPGPCNNRFILMKKGKARSLAFLVSVLLTHSSNQLYAEQRLAGWVSEENCKEQHAKPGGKDCVKKCLRGGAHVGHPEWIAQKMVLVEEQSKAIWMVGNPDSLKGYEGERVEIFAEVNRAENSLKVTGIQPYRDPVPSKLFEFHNGFWINLHHFLRGEARRKLHPDTKPRVTLVVNLSADETESWNGALDYYGKNFAEKDLLFDQELLPIKNSLSAAEGSSEPSADIHAELREVLIRAAPVYKKHWWPEQERANREWILVAQRLLDQFGLRISKRMKQAYGIEWPQQPLRTDVTVEAGWSGAYTSEDPVHITIASTEARIQDYAALETLFHEASHGWDAWLSEKLNQVALETKRTLPEKFWHSVIFYTAGEITRSELEQAGLRDYIPYAELNHIYERRVPEERCALERIWKPYLQNPTPDPEKAFQELVAAITNCKS